MLHLQHSHSASSQRFVILLDSLDFQTYVVKIKHLPISFHVLCLIVASLNMRSAYNTMGTEGTVE